MASYTQPTNTSNQVITQYENAQIFIGRNRYQTATYTNGTGSEVTITPGTLLGRIYSSDKVTPHLSTATNGSEQPVGVAADTYVVANGSSVTVTFCDGGDVAEGKITLGGSDTLATIVSRTYTDSGSQTVTVQSGTIRDLIARNTQIKLVSATELTGYDNQ